MRVRVRVRVRLDACVSVCEWRWPGMVITRYSAKSNELPNFLYGKVTFHEINANLKRTVNKRKR